MAESTNTVDENYSQLANQLVASVPVDKLLSYDDRLHDILFEKFHNIGTCGNGIYSIFDCLIKKWTHSSGSLAITKEIPIIVAGSKVEGASLSELFIPDDKETMEGECNLMYVVGRISGDIAGTCLQEVSGQPGCLQIRDSPEVMLHTPSILVPQKQNDNMHNSFINADKIKLSMLKVKPLNIQHKAKEPISENATNAVARFYEETINRLENYMNEYNTNFKSLREHESTSVETLRVVDDDKQDDDSENFLDEDVKKEMLLQLVEATKSYAENKKKIFNVEGVILGYLKNLVQILTFKNREEKISIEKSIDRLSDDAACIENFIDESYLTELENVSQQTVKEMILLIDKMMPLRWFSYFGLQKRDEEIEEIKTVLIDLLSKVLGATEMVEDENVNLPDVKFVNSIPCFYCPFWPIHAADWLQRARLWPTTDDVSSIMQKGCYVAAMSSLSNPCYWYWSFATAEMKLSQLQSRMQKYSYFVFKSFFCKYLKFEMDGEVFPSYIAKTCMMYVSEQHEEQWWGQENDVSQVVKCVIELFTYLKDALFKESFPHYFIGGINLFINFSKNHLKKAFDIVTDIINSPEEHLIIDELTSTKINLQYSNINLDYDRSNAWETTSITRDAIKLYEQLIVNKAMKVRCAIIIQSGDVQRKKSSLKVEIDEQCQVKENQKDTCSVQESIDSKMQIQKALEEEQRLASRVLKETALLFGFYCLNCDVCEGKIMCGDQANYHCSEGCDYDECASCFNKRESAYNRQWESGANEQTPDTVSPKLHSHRLIKREKCPRDCFPTIPQKIDENMGTKWMLLMENYTKETKEIIQKINLVEADNIYKTLCEEEGMMKEILEEIKQDLFDDTTKENKTDSSEKMKERDIFVEVDDLKFILNKIDQLKMFIEPESGPGTNLLYLLREEYNKHQATNSLGINNGSNNVLPNLPGELVNMLNVP